MKKVYILLILVILPTLVSCQLWQVDTAQENEGKNLETNTQTDMAELTGSVVIDTNHPLAGETLIFDVEIMNIKKSASGSITDTVETGDSIEVHYTGTLQNGEKFDSSRDREQTLPFTVGAGQMIPGFDAGVIWMKLGESKTLTLDPTEAYGEKDLNNTQTIPKSDLSDFVNAGYSLEVWEKLPTQFWEFEIIEVIEE